MLKSKNLYELDYAIREWARALAMRMTGRHCQFLALIAEDGVTRQIMFDEASRQYDIDMRDALFRAGRSFIFYDPALDEESELLQWNRIRKPWIERIVGADFGTESLALRQGDKELDQFPESRTIIL